ncbi:hypothetical protein PENVUL_c011G05913 [Penicillium vulpinum]|nr:hypothetical protein PENVUL_c011G05913 [Penicillium vulpinum]
MAPKKQESFAPG